jgi:hypothetical protein
MGKTQTNHTTGAVPVNIDNFIRAETDMYFGKKVQEGGLGQLFHSRQMAAIDNQSVVRMNRDTIYSSGVFDLEAAPLIITLPQTGKRFMSMQVISQDHFTIAVVYGPGSFTYTKEQVGTRYVFVIIRTLANPEDLADLKAANELQDQIKVEQARKGSFEIPYWDVTSQNKVRNALNALAPLSGSKAKFGNREEVDPVSHLIGTALGWGGNPNYAAVYKGVFPKRNDGKTVHQLQVKDVPVDGFWSISIYNEKGFFEKNDRGSYSVNNLTAKQDADGSYTIQFGGCEGKVVNCLPIMPGWNYTVRLYRPRPEILNGTWTFPEAQPVA